MIAAKVILGGETYLIEAFYDHLTGSSFITVNGVDTRMN